jgi:hypothetical protein
MATIKKKRLQARTIRGGISAAEVAQMIEDATVDAHDESEQATGWFTMFENHLDLPFDTDVLGVRVTVENIALRDDDRIVAVCRRGKQKQLIDITDLPCRRRSRVGRSGSRRTVIGAADNEAGRCQRDSRSAVTSRDRPSGFSTMRMCGS